MVDYSPLWHTMKEKKISTYVLINKGGINPHTINNLKHNRGITVSTLEQLCLFLKCTPNDVLKFIPDKE